MLSIAKANIEEINDVANHYKTVINQIKDNDNNPGWKFGVHPTRERLKNSIESGELYIGKYNSQIVSSIVLDHNPLEANDKVKWAYDLENEKVFFIHLVAVNQKCTNKGFAKKMLNYTFDLAKQNSIKTIRLSLNINNINIENLYLKAGFQYVDTVEVYIEGRGRITFNLYEKLL